MRCCRFPDTNANAGPAEFVATLSPEGLVQLRGRLSDETLRQAADSYAKARFGSANVYTATRLVKDLPADWPVRVLVGLEALSMLSKRCGDGWPRQRAGAWNQRPQGHKCRDRGSAVGQAGQCRGL